MYKLVGFGAHGGIALGEVIRLVDEDHFKDGEVSSPEEEARKLNTTFRDTISEISILKQSLFGKTDKKYLEMLDVHLLVLEDPTFREAIEGLIFSKRISVEDAIKEVVAGYKKKMEGSKEKDVNNNFAEIRDVSGRLLANLSYSAVSKEILHNKIVVLDNIRASLLLECRSRGINILGLVTSSYGPNSHAAILSKAFKIPSVFCTKGLDKIKWSNIKDGILDSRSGCESVILNPEDQYKDQYIDLIEEFKKEQDKLEKYRKLEPITKCGSKLSIDLNICVWEELWDVEYAASIGLFRTEFLFMLSSSLPTEEEQVQLYGQLLKNLKGVSSYTVIRVLDIGSDKHIPYLPLRQEENPALGLRGIRVLLRKRDLFKTQLRAILRASSLKKIKILYPMVTNHHEIIEANQILEECKKELLEEGHDIDKKIEVGAMIEVPSAALTIDKIVEHVDFVSIGTNDLTQYMLVADRQNSDVSHIYDSLDSSVLRLIDFVASHIKEKGKKINVCGELATTPEGIVALLSLGIKSFSVNPSLVGLAKQVISSIELKGLEDIRDYILESGSGEKNRGMIKMFLEEVIG